MLYGDEKKLEMARSILPSTKRGWARAEKKRIHKKERAAAKQACRDALCSNAHDTDLDLAYRAKSDRYHLIVERRAADKVSQFVTWAQEVTKDLPKEDRLSYIRRILPDGLIGMHALSHIDFLDHFNMDGTRRIWSPSSAEERAEMAKNRRVVYEQERERLRSALIDICNTPGAHRDLNRYMGRHHKMVKWNMGVSNTDFVRTYSDEVGTEKCVGAWVPRLLEGVGDIHDFLDSLDAAASARPIQVEPYLVRYKRRNYVWRDSGRTPHTWYDEFFHTTRENPDHHPEWKLAVKTYVQAWYKHHGDVVAVRTELKIR